MQNKHRGIGLVLTVLLATSLFAEANIPSEVDPSSGKLEFSITLATLTGRGFDLPLLFTYNSGVWHHDFAMGDYTASTWLKGPSPFGLGWDCNLGGRTFRIKDTQDSIRWFFAGNDNKVHPFAYYDQSGLYAWRTTDNTWIKISETFNGNISNTETSPTLPNGVHYDSSTAYHIIGIAGDQNFADDEMSGYRYYYIEDANGNRPFEFHYDTISEWYPIVLKRIEGLKDTAIFFYHVIDSLNYPPLLDSILVRSGTVYRRLLLHITMHPINIPTYMGSYYSMTNGLGQSSGDSLPLLDSVSMNGNTLYRFYYNSEGELKRVINRSGGKKEYAYISHDYWEYDTPHDQCEFCYTRRVDTVKVTPRSGETYTWNYTTYKTGEKQNPDSVRVACPSGGYVHFTLYSFTCGADCETPLSRDGLVKEVRYFAGTPNTYGTNYLYQTTSNWVSDVNTHWNLRIDSTSTTWKNTVDGSPDYRSYTIVDSVDKYNNPVKIANIVWGSGDPSLYWTYYTYKTDAGYINRNMINLVENAYTGWISDEQFLSRTLYYYDQVTPETYSGSHAGWVDPNSTYRGNITKVTTYAASGNTFNVLGLGGNGPTIAYRYDQFGNQTKVINYPSSSEPETTFTYYSTDCYVFPERTVNHVTSYVDSLYTVTKWNFHTGLPDSTMDFNGQWTRYTYDDFGRVLTVKQPGETSASSRHHYYETASVPYQVDSSRLDDSRWLVSCTYTDGFGATIQAQAIDNSGEKTLITDYCTRLDSNFTRSSNTRELSQVLSYYLTPNWGSLKNSTTYFDFLGRDSLSIDQTGNKIRTKYDIDGAPRTLVTIQNDSVNYWQSWTKTILDESGRTQTVIHGGIHGSTTKADTTTFSYILGSYPVSLASCVRNPKGDTTFYYYDKGTNLRGINSPDMDSATTYTSNGAAKVVDVFITYDDMGRVIEKLTPKGTVETEYDEIGRVKKIQGDQVGTFVEMKYDSLGIVEGDTTSYGIGKLSYSKVWGVRGIRYSYDRLGRMTVRDVRMPFFSKWKTIGYVYNDAGLLTKLAYPEPDTGSTSDTVRYFYDNFGRLDSVYGFVKNIHYGTNGLADSITYWNGTYTKYSYNDRLGLTQILTRKTSDLVNLSFSYENNGLIHQITDGRSSSYTQTYKYDYLGQLAKYSCSIATDTFSYDGAGNRTQRNTNTYTYENSTNQLISAEGWSFGYDASGNLIRQVKGTERLFFDYDVLGRLTEFRNDSIIDQYAPTPGDTIVNYVYGGAGDLRARKIVRVCTDSNVAAGSFIKMPDEFEDLVLEASGQGILTDPARDLGDVYIRNCSDTFYLAIIPKVMDTSMTTCNFAIAIDNDRVEGSGKARLPMDTMSLLATSAWWEYCIYLNSKTSYGYYDTNGTQHSQPGGMSFDHVSAQQLNGMPGTNDTAFLVKIIKDSLAIDSILRIAVFSFRPGFTNSDEYLNGGSSASDVAPGGSESVIEGYQVGYIEVHDPEPNDPNPGPAYTFTDFYRVYVYDGLTPIIEYSAPYAGEFDHAPVRYVYGFPGATARLTTKTSGSGRDTFFLHTDANGSVRSITNSSGTEVQRYRYDPFGNLLDSTGTDTGNTRRFCGKDWDKEHSQLYMAARHYDPRFGRFNSCDPEHTFMSPYTYCLNNPVSLVDPTGHAPNCGGAYSVSFNTMAWRLIFTGSFIWTPKAAKALPYSMFRAKELSFGSSNPTFTDASGELIEYDAPWPTYLFQVTEAMIGSVFVWLYNNVPEFKKIVDMQKNQKNWYEVTYKLLYGEKAAALEYLVSGAHSKSSNPEILIKEYVETEKKENVLTQLALGFLHEEVEIYVIHTWDTEVSLGTGPAHDVADEYTGNYLKAGFFCEYPYGGWQGSHVGEDMSGWWKEHGDGMPSVIDVWRNQCWGKKWFEK